MAAFQKLRGLSIELDRIQDNIGKALETSSAPIKALVAYSVTTADPIESTVWPSVKLPAGMRKPGHISVGRVVNTASPLAFTYEAHSAKWHPSGGRIAIDFITGLEPSTAYAITLEVTADA